MVKSIIEGSSSIFVICFIGLVGASKLASAGAGLEGEEIGLGVRPIGGPELSLLADEVLLEELSYRGYGFGGGFGRGGFGGRPGFGHGPVRRPLPFRGRGHLRRHGLEGPGGIGGLGGVGAVGAVGGVKSKEAALDAAEIEGRNRDHNEIEGSQGSLVAAGKKFDVGQQTNLHSNNDGIHSHTGFDNDKVFVKTRNSGSNDLDIVHNSNDLSTGSHLSKGSGIVAAQGSQNRLENDRENSQRLGLLNARENEKAAGGAVGGVGAIV